MSRGRDLAPVVAVAGLAAAAAALLLLVDPNRPGRYPTCPFLLITGYYCPGCGSLRASYALLHGDLAVALARNPLAVVAAPLLVVAFGLWAVRRLGLDAPHPTRIPAWMLWLLAVLVVVYGVLRNLPGATWLSPG